MSKTFPFCGIKTSIINYETVILMKHQKQTQNHRLGCRLMRHNILHKIYSLRLNSPNQVKPYTHVQSQHAVCASGHGASSRVCICLSNCLIKISPLLHSPRQQTICIVNTSPEKRKRAENLRPCS